MRKVLYIMGQLHDEDVEWMAQMGHRRELAPGDIIIRQGTQTAHLFIVLSGMMEVEVDRIGIVARLSGGEIIGEMSFVDNAPPSATVRAAEAATVLALDKRLMQERLATSTGFAARFYKALAIYLADRLRATQTKETRDGGIEEDELDEAVLDQVSMAGVRYKQMLKTLMGAQVARMSSTAGSP